MDLNEILNKHSGSSKRPGSYISLTSGNSPAVSSLFEKLSIRDLYLIRSLHLELTLSPATPDSIEQFLLDHVDHNISQLLDTSFTALKYDRNTELGFESRKKMKSLLEIFKYKAYQEISTQEFFDLYAEWLRSYEINDLTTAQSSKEINEIFTFFLLQEENEDFVQNISIAIENILDGVYSFFSKELETTRNVTAEWNAEAEKLFSLLDEDRKGHLEAEAIQFWVLTLLAPEVGCIEPILFRKQTSAFLQEMQHSNGLVTMRGWKNYLLNKHWNESLTLKLMSENFEKTIGVWKDIRVRVFNSESLANYNYLRSSEEKLPSIWNQCILSCVFLSGTRTDNEKLAKYLRFIGLQLGSTASLSTKGVVYIKGTHIHDISEFSIYIMANFLQFSGQYNTSASISTLTQQALDTLSTDPRFKSIRKALQTYDNLLNIVMYELISSFPKGPREIPVPSKSSMKLKYSSTTSVLNSSARSTTPNNSESTRKIASSKFTAKDVQSMKKLRESKDLPKRTRSPLLQTPQKKNSFVDIRKKELEKSATLASTKGDFPREKTNFTRHSKSPVRLKPNFKETNRSKSPIRDNSKSPARKSTKESYEEVMKRLKSK